jgi:hypothetical protein
MDREEAGELGVLFGVDQAAIDEKAGHEAPQ